MKYLIFLFLFLTSIFPEQKINSDEISFFVSKKDDIFYFSNNNHQSIEDFSTDSRGVFSFFSFVFDFVVDFVSSSLSQVSNQMRDPLEKSMLNFVSGIIGDVFQKIKNVFFSRDVFLRSGRFLEVSIDCENLCNENSIKKIAQFKVKIDSDGNGCDGNNLFFSEEQAKSVTGEFVNYLTQETLRADFFELRENLDPLKEVFINKYSEKIGE